MFVLNCLSVIVELFLQLLLKLLQTIDYGINTECLSLKFTFLNMKPHKQLFLLRHIAMGRGDVEKVLHYLDEHKPALFSHTSKTMEDCDMLSFLHVVLQVCLEYWHSSCPFKEYVPDFMKPSRCVQDECAHMITEIISLLKHIRSCQYLPTISMVEKWIVYRN